MTALIIALTTHPLAALDGVSLQRVQSWLLTDGLRILLTVLLALLVRWTLNRFIHRLLTAMSAKSARKQDAALGGPANATAPTEERHIQRVATLASLLRSIVSLVVLGIASLTVMALLGIPLGPLLASAGVGGVALGFGAQSLVKDFLSGIFMILEDQYGVGDVIDTGQAIGTVEEVTLRVTRLRDLRGVTWYIRNGEVVRIGNMTQVSSNAVVDIPVAYDENLDKVLSTIRNVAEGMGTDPAWVGKVIDTPTVLGVETMTGAMMTIRVLAACAPGQHWAVQRELRQRVKTALDAAGVKAPPVMPYGGPQ
jgi:small conductance mechanosensitive channel